MLIEVENPLAAKTGDRVVLSLKTVSLIKAAFLIYIFPILCMLAGALVGSYVAGRMGANVSAMAAICGGSAFVVAILFIRFQGNRLGQKPDYRPKIVRIIRV